MDKSLSSLLLELKKIRDESKKLRKDLERFVADESVRNICATGRHFDVLPYSSERMRMERGEIVDKPKDLKNKWLFHFDRNDRLVGIESFDEQAKRDFLQVVKYSESSAVSRSFFVSDAVRIGSVWILEFDSVGRLVNSAFLHPNDNADFESYEYSGAKLVAITQRAKYKGQEQLEEYKFTFKYSGNGECEAFLNTNGTTSLIFRTISAKSADRFDLSGLKNGSHRRNLNELKKRFEAQLVESITSIVSKSRVRGKACCLAINYGNDPIANCIPQLGLGLRDTLPIQINEIDDFAKLNDEALNPANFENFASKALQLEKDSAIKEFDIELRKMAQHGQKIDLRKICLKVAIELNGLKWKGIEKPFLFYAVDDDLCDLRRNLSEIFKARRPT